VIAVLLAPSATSDDWLAVMVEPAMYDGAGGGGAVVLRSPQAGTVLSVTSSRRQ
jgi:hypothetical protein